MCILAQVLAKKMIAIMELSQQQLSKQDHYDYGLRSFVIPIARAAGQDSSLLPVNYSSPCYTAALQSCCKTLYQQMHQPCQQCR